MTSIDHNYELIDKSTHYLYDDDKTDHIKFVPPNYYFITYPKSSVNISITAITNEVLNNE